VNNFEKRLNFLEQLASFEEENIDRPYTWDDWSKEEIHEAAESIFNGTELRPKLLEKAKLTGRGRLSYTAGMSKEEIEAAVEEILEKRRNFNG
jgi:hypothetical protein